MSDLPRCLVDGLFTTKDTNDTKDKNVLEFTFVALVSFVVKGLW